MPFVKSSCLIAISRLIVLIDDVRMWQEHPRRNALTKRDVEQIILDLKIVRDNCGISMHRKDTVQSVITMLEQSPWQQARHIINHRHMINLISSILLELAQNQ